MCGESDKHEIQRLTDLSRHDLLEELGKHLYDKEFHGTPDYVRRANDWLEEKKGILYKAICAEDRWPALKREKEKNELFDAFVAVADAWLGQICGNIPVLTVAVVLFTQGLDQLCGCE